MIQVANIFSIILYESLYAKQQVISLLKSVLHHSLIGHVNRSGLIVQVKEIKVGI